MCSVVKCSNVIIHSSVKFKSFILNLFGSISGIKYLLIGVSGFQANFPLIHKLSYVCRNSRMIK